MDAIGQFLDLLLHVDDKLALAIEQYGTWTYLILFAIVFCETGLVVTPILPGDSLLFAAGAFAAKGSLDVPTLIALLSVAAIGGDALNYTIGNYLGPKVLSRDGRFLKRAYLDRTRRFYDRYGGKTIILARFVPIVRTFAPFLAGVGTMSYPRFASYNVVGGIFWVAGFVLLGFYFGNLPIVQRNFEFVILGIVFVSILPAVVSAMLESWRARREPGATTGTKG